MTTEGDPTPNPEGATTSMASTHVDSTTMARRLRFGHNVRRFRHSLGLSQEQLAERAGMDRKTVNRIEQGVHSVRLDNVWLIAEALDVDIRDLFEDPEQVQNERAASVIPAPSAPTSSLTWGSASTASH